MNKSKCVAIHLQSLGYEKNQQQQQKKKTLAVMNRITFTLNLLPDQLKSVMQCHYGSLCLV